MPAKFVKAVRWLTVDQYREIDRHYMVGDAPKGGAIAVLIGAALALIVARYFGRADFVLSFPEARDAFASWPYKEIYPRLYWALFKTVNYFIIPAIVIKFFLKERIRDYGFTGKPTRKIWWMYLAMLLVVLPLVFIVSYSPEFLARYPKYAHAGRSLEELLMWELAYGYQFLLLEFFFRGFMLYGLARHVGHLAIFIMIVPYAMIHFGKPMAETFGSVIAGVALGTLALRTRSIYGGVLIHCAVAWSMDLCAMWQKSTLYGMSKAGAGM